MGQKNSFLIYKDSLNILDDLTDEECGKLFKAIKDYQINGNVDIQDRYIRLVFKTFETQFIRDEEKYQEISRRRAEAGRSHKGNQYSILEQNGTNGTNKTNVPFLEQNGTNGTDSDSDSDSDSDNVIDRDNIEKSNTEVLPKKTESFLPPISDEDIENSSKQENNPIVEEKEKEEKKEEKLSAKKECAKNYNSKLKKIALEEKAKAEQRKEELDPYYRLFLRIDRDYSSILHQLRYMSKSSYDGLIERYGMNNVFEVIKDIDNGIDYIIKKKQSELGRVLHNWLSKRFPELAKKTA